MARLVDLAARRGQTGVVEPLAAFFKQPLGACEHDFAKQHRELVEWAAAMRHDEGP